MSILNYFCKIDKVLSDNDEGLKELLGPNVLKEANTELRRVKDSPEPGCSTGPSSQTKRWYNVYSQKKCCLINFLPSHNVLKIMDPSCIHFKTSYNVNCTVNLQFGRCDLLFALHDICMPL